MAAPDSRCAPWAAICGLCRPPQRSTLKPASKLRTWRVSLLRQRAQYLGMVEAPDEKAAEAAAVAQFDLNDEQRKRLAVRAK
jgi:hypothetical protein